MPRSRSRVLPFLVSGSSEAALVAQARRLREFVEARPELDPAGGRAGRWRSVARSCRIARWRSPAGWTSWRTCLRAFERGEFVDGLVRGRRAA